jgi:hypothetical protein
MNNKVSSSVLIIRLIIFSFLLFFVSPSHAITLTNPIIKDMSQAYGFYIGQKHSLSEIVKMYPELSNQAKISERAFNTAFLSSIKNIDSLLEDLDKNKWESIKQGIRNQAQKTNISRITKQQSVDFIKLVKKRARGEIESPVIEALLMFNPSYEKQPVKEFNDGFRQKYNSDGTGKAKGVSFSIEVPTSWASKEASRPNIVRKFISANGRGLEMIMILVKSFPLPKGQKITISDVREILNSKDIKDFIPTNGNYRDSGELTIESLPGFWMRYSMEGSRVRQRVKMEIIAYSIFYGNKMIQIQGQIGQAGDISPDKNLKRFKTFEPIFDLVANSLVIPDIYK